MKNLSETEAVETILAAFDGSKLNPCTLPALDPVRPLRHCRLLWGQQPGWAYLGWGTGSHWVDNSYRHSKWRTRFFRWPAQATKLGQAAVRMALTGDVYVAPLLRAQPSPKSGTNLLAGQWCWADVDGDWTDERQTWLDRLGDTTFSVASGRGRHVYVALDRLVEPERLGELNRVLAAGLAGDSKWSPAALLRLGGTWNWKTSPPTLTHRIR
jgi:hypothetical protein